MDLFDLDKPLLQFPSDTQNSAWTLRHAVEGVQIFGGIGSGKTSGSARMLALKYLSNGFGGLVLTVKRDEKAAWMEYCRLTKRSKDLIIIEPKGDYNFNFLEYESTHSEFNEAITDNIVEVLKTVIRAGAEKENAADDPFWESALDMLIFNVIDLCKMAYGTLSVQMMYDIVQSLPKSAESTTKNDKGQDTTTKEVKAFDKTYNAAHAALMKKIKGWWEKLPSSNREALEADDQLYNDALLEAIPDVRLLKFLHEFFFDSFKNLSQKTRSIVEFIFLGFLFRLLREPVYSMFCRNTSNVTPEDSLKGKIILINLPVKVYHKVGRDCQILFKYIWQRAMERRQVTSSSRPVFLWADEAQNFLHEHDADYQATARSSRISTVYITQNLPNYYASMGGQKAEYRVKSFLGTLGTKIFHANADMETNRYSSELLGDGFFTDVTESITTAEDFSKTNSVSLKLDRRVRPEEFISLKTGGPLNKFRVEGYLHRQGDNLFNKQNYKKMSFNQLYIP
jgi:type IV secretory pathway TraG/TraD family ATPase VirD4